MRVIQVMNALDYGDGVSKDVINKYHIFQELGFDTSIYSKWVHDECRSYWRDINELQVEKDDIIFHHFSGESHILDKILKCNCIKILVYHNMTPSYFFGANDTSYMVGEQQLKKYYTEYEYMIAVSEFNLKDLKAMGINLPMSIVPILIDFDAISRYKTEKNTGQKKTFLFVGRVVQNKCHLDIIKVFEYYYTNINCNSQLVFVGNYNDYMDYYNLLLENLSGLNCKNHVIFKGKVKDSVMYQEYYRADLFLCLSEHEGFCIPLLESMYCGIPTIAYDACAVKATMGTGGLLVNTKDPELLAKICHIVLENKEINHNIIRQQNQWVQNFSHEEIKKSLQDIIMMWRS